MGCWRRRRRRAPTERRPLAHYSNPVTRMDIGRFVTAVARHVGGEEVGWTKPALRFLLRQDRAEPLPSPLRVGQDGSFVLGF